MQIHELQPKHKSRSKKRIGRGGKKGTYSGHGMKGQKSRAGRKMVPIIRELIKRYPKLKGYRRFVLQDFSAVVNLEFLEKNSKDGDIINPENLIKKGIVSKIKGRVPEIKILGTGKFSKKIIVEKCKVSASAKTAIEKAGGVIKN
jgi:large subunit ribosomal protein L15